MSNKTLYVVVAAAGIGLASAGAWWFQNRAAPAPVGGPLVGTPPTGAPAGAGRTGGVPGVEVAPVKTLRIQDDAQAVGTLRSRQSVTLRPEVSGRIAQIGFADGARVRRGQLLVQLDDVLQRAELSQAQAQLSIARANLKRNQELVAENFVAQRVLDESQANLQVAEAQVALAQARLQRMRVTAPFDGTVGLRSINLGEYVKDGADLVNLEDTSALTVDFRLPERYQTRIAAGQSVQVQLDALPGQSFVARVQAVDPLLDANGRSVAVRAVLPPSPAGDLRPGMFARVLTVFSVDEAALVVPEEALVPQGGKQFVFKLEKEGEGDAARLVSRRTEVQLGVRQGAQVQVLAGLAAGDTVVVAGQQRLQRDGTAVRVVDMNKPGGGPRAAGGAPGGSAAGAGSAPAAAPAK
ncbi:MAG: efflux RND transporter periplasmic adaptor subunit [Hydrogenophaga sp.]|jgi:membrane fusion protein (multidrug efflux system)|uniref:efflux RND transporter periplasmic adaptor subunit n=1 Tax=Hydrogenophaga sp. TaxID=1904254 RepID=UPI00271CAF34|nr:efflux RND transporter periplasmic adaptor subunit [Hydrogenophaga sp.]MDO9479358.1 efflux RND transporter periplasmic adaptor subunit [Hydrogenophaga sp.]MDP2220531.1 efflux RND transporter periplasmic adaptor subunit [Hydrogenophaga sp.]MDP3343285.1 efflux RND transporter periplasmic adaptor subunit [Hydrogenophaga sp.]MDP3373427.1 efflux RND transporter periplasmic adaptor subunit [Hydrogenophaga sp.]MDP3808990.1 efflux RND transporter periplasmic adaptor subunit [Hydrogenophaga sp.]